MQGFPTDSIGDVLDRFADAMFRMMIERYKRHLDELDLTMVQAQVLRLLQTGSLSTGELAGELGISAPAVTQLTDRLIRKRLIERRAAPADRRSVMVVLTARGKRTLDRFKEKRGDVFRIALDRLSEAERGDVLASLVKMLAAMEAPASRAALRAVRASNYDGEERLI